MLKIRFIVTNYFQLVELILNNTYSQFYNIVAMFVAGEALAPSCDITVTLQ